MKKNRRNEGSVGWNGNINGFYLKSPVEQKNMASYTLQQDETREEVCIILNKVLDLVLTTGQWLELDGLDIKEEGYKIAEKIYNNKIDETVIDENTLLKEENKLLKQKLSDIKELVSMI